MNITFSNTGWDDYQLWISTADKKSLRRLSQLFEEIRRNNSSGIGKPEQLKGRWSGFWSRRIDEKNRIVYRYIDGSAEIAQCKGHYND